MLPGEPLPLPGTLAAFVAGKRALLFDLFHTLVDVERMRRPDEPPTHARLGVDREAWIRVVFDSSADRTLGRVRDPFAIIAGMARAIDPAIPDHVIRETARARNAVFTRTLLDPPAESLAVLAALRAAGKRLALVSNADAAEVEAWPRSPLAPLFDEAIFSCDVALAKPDPAIYRLALDRLGVAPGDACFVGDGGSDEHRGARQAGIATVFTPWLLYGTWPEAIPQRCGIADWAAERLADLVPS